MEKPNAGAVPGQVGRAAAGGLPISMIANVVLALVAAGAGIWGWTQQQRTVALQKMVAEADQKAVAAIAERDEAWENSRDLQSRLVNAKGLMNQISDPFPQPPLRSDDDLDSPP